MLSEFSSYIYESNAHKIHTHSTFCTHLTPEQVRASNGNHFASHKMLSGLSKPGHFSINNLLNIKNSRLKFA